MSLPANIRLFIAFRVFFNARFYYPVLAVFFVDLGLTIDQYALLNVAWAASIVFFELPLGAVADRVGRRPLVVGAAALMVVEMAVLAFAPTGRPTLLFVVFLINRILSGLAEAAASGADEALAYDTLVDAKRADEWPQVLSYLQRFMSGGFLLSMIVGGAVYDPEFVNRMTELELDQLTTARFPVYLTLGMSLGAVVAALRMTEPAAAGRPATPPNFNESWSNIVAAGAWIKTTVFVLAIILFGLAIDSVVRLFLTLTSSYYRLLGIPEGLFGLLGATFGLLGFVSPTLSRALLRRCSPFTDFGVVGLIVLIGLVGVAWVGNWIGVVFVAVLALGWHMLNFLASHFLNAATESSRRATVLSFRSLAGNLAYGAVGGLYALAFRFHGDGDVSEEQVLAKTLVWFPVVLVGALAPLFLWARGIRRMRQP